MVLGDSSPWLASESGESEFTSWDLTRLFCRWSLASTPRAHVVFVHGIAEHSGRYGFLRDALVTAGISFYAFDHRGHGRSPGARGDCLAFEDFAKDVAEFARLVRSSVPSGPLFVVGHSMGSLITALYATRHDAIANGIALASLPARLADPPSLLKLTLTKCLAMAIPTLLVDPGLDPAALTHDASVIEETKADPLMLHRITVRLGTGLIEAAGNLVAKAPLVRVPTLLLYGSGDSVVSLKGVEQFREQLLIRDVQFTDFTDLWHELFLEAEPQRNRVFSTLINWIQEHTLRNPRQ